MTRGEALQLSLDWALGTKSYNNVFLGAEPDPAHRVRTLAAIVQADAAESTKWAVLAAVLPEREPE